MIKLTRFSVSIALSLIAMPFVFTPASVSYARTTGWTGAGKGRRYEKLLRNSNE